MISTPEVIEVCRQRLNSLPVSPVDKERFHGFLDRQLQDWKDLDLPTRERIYQAVNDAKFGNGKRFKSVDGVFVNPEIYDV